VLHCCVALTRRQAGLFSAVATGFIIEACVVRQRRLVVLISPPSSYKDLKPDYAMLTAVAYLASINRTDVLESSGDEPVLATFRPSATARWINGLWFASLALALAVALLAILAKQWLGEYVSRMRAHIGSCREWAWRHQVFSRGLDQWNVDAFVSTLPLLLHLSLFIFLIGLVVFLWDTDQVIAISMLSFTILVALFYVSSTAVPLWFGSCPTATPILRQARAAAERVAASLVFFSYSLWRRCVRVLTAIRVISQRSDLGSTYTGRYAWNPPAYNIERLFSPSPARRDSEVLSWMIASLPASEDVRVCPSRAGVILGLGSRSRYRRGSNRTSKPL
jgi:hypothetical protein